MIRNIGRIAALIGAVGVLLAGAPDARAEVAAGRWSGTTLNRFKDHQTISFDVSEDGRRVENVTFTGYWDCKSSGLTVLKDLDPPGTYDVDDGAFGDTRRDEKAAMWWELEGRFLSDRSAEGTLLIAFAGTECTSYRLKWVAQPK